MADVLDALHDASTGDALDQLHAAASSPDGGFLAGLRQGSMAARLATTAPTDPGGVLDTLSDLTGHKAFSDATSKLQSGDYKGAAVGYLNALTRMTPGAGIVIDSATAATKAAQAIKTGDYKGALDHIATAVPALGPVIQGGVKMASGQPAEGAGEAVGPLLDAALFKAAGKVPAIAGAASDLASSPVARDVAGIVSPRLAHAMSVADRLKAGYNAAVGRPAAAPPPAPQPPPGTSTGAGLGASPQALAAPSAAPAAPPPVNPYFAPSSTTGFAPRVAAGADAFARPTPAPEPVAAPNTPNMPAPAPEAASVLQASTPAPAPSPAHYSIEANEPVVVTEAKQAAAANAAAKMHRFADYLSDPKINGSDPLTGNPRPPVTGNDVRAMSDADYAKLHEKVPTGKLDAKGNPKFSKPSSSAAALTDSKMRLASELDRRSTQSNAAALAGMSPAEVMQMSPADYAKATGAPASDVGQARAAFELQKAKLAAKPGALDAAQALKDQLDAPLSDVDELGNPTSRAAPLSNNAAAMLKAVNDLEPVKGVPVGTDRLRAALRLSKPDFDAAALELRRAQKAFLSLHADPNNLLPADQTSLIKDAANGTYHVGVAAR